MFGWLRRKSRQELLLENILQVLGHVLGEAKSAHVRIVQQHVVLNELKNAPDQLSEAVDLMKREPFTALKTWIEQSTASQLELQRQRREFVERERQLLERWRKHAAALEARIPQAVT